MGILKSSSGLSFQTPEGQSRRLAFPEEHPTGHIQGVRGSRGPGKPLLVVSVLSSVVPEEGLIAHPSVSGIEEEKMEEEGGGSRAGGRGRASSKPPRLPWN